MKKEKYPITPAVRLLRQAGVAFTDHLYGYEDHGGTAVSARELGVDEHSVIKTIIMEDDRKKPLVVLMHGDLEISARQLARLAGCRSITACSPEAANRHTGYLVGGTSPFATRASMPVYMEESILELPRIYINGGKRGYLIGMDPKDAARMLNPTLVNVGIEK
jgi:Cys-tRNA(Pro) deacylase